MGREFRVRPRTAAELREWAAEMLAEADAIEASDCTGVTASWCPVHGDCTCPESEAERNDRDCLLHSPDSNHADTVET